MNRYAICAVWPILIAFAASVMADRCVGPKDASVSGPPYNIPLVNPADIVFCDDFDSYCSSNYSNNIHWPGYPPTPDNTFCSSAVDTTYSEWWLKQHWTKPYSGGPQFGVSNVDPDQGGVRLEGWDGSTGWASLPFVAQSSGNQDGYNDPNRGSAYANFDMAGAIAHRFPGATAVNGTDDAPLVLRYWLHDDQGFWLGSQVGWGMVANWPWYMELFLDNDRAPTDYTIYYDSTCPNPYGWPVVCQQAPGTAPGLPASCPPLSTVVHGSMTFGWMAPLDTNPCDVETGRKPTMYHAATFDGLYWRRLTPNTYPGDGGGFQYDMQQAYFEMTIRSTTYTVRLIAPVDTIGGAAHGQCTSNCYAIRTSTATLPRNYLGPFNKIGMGIAPGCELDPTTGACKAGTVRDQHAWWWDDATCHWVDRVVVYGGVGNLTSLDVSPTETFLTAGEVGGSFAPQCKTYTLHNSGTTSLTWTAAKTQSWLNVTPTSGTLAAGASTNVNVCVNANANALAFGTYTGQIVFTDATSVKSQTRNVQLQAGHIDCFTEMFTNNNDLTHSSLTLTPDTSPHGYSACHSSATAFPTDPSQGTSLGLTGDTNTKVSLAGGAKVYLYGQAYSEFYVGSNGYITFGSGDTTATATLTDHFRLKRISGLFANLEPATNAVTWKQLLDRVAVTYQDVPEVGTSGNNSFQIELFYDGRIRLTWLGLAATDGLAGISRGTGQPSYFVASDLTGYAACPAAAHPADFDADSDVDLEDFAHFQACLTGPGVFTINPACGNADLDMDGDVDQADLLLFPQVHEGG